MTTVYSGLAALSGVWTGTRKLDPRPPTHMRPTCAVQGDVVLAATAAAPAGGGQLGTGRSGPASDGGLAQEDAGSADEDSGDEGGGAGEDGLQRSLSREHADAPGVPGGCCCRCLCAVCDSNMGLPRGPCLMCAIGICCCMCLPQVLRGDSS